MSLHVVVHILALLVLLQNKLKIIIDTPRGEKKRNYIRCLNNTPPPNAERLETDRKKEQEVRTQEERKRKEEDFVHVQIALLSHMPTRTQLFS